MPSEPTATEPSVEHIATESTVTEPAAAGPTAVEPAAIEPTTTESAGTAPTASLSTHTPTDVPVGSAVDPVNGDSDLDSDVDLDGDATVSLPASLSSEASADDTYPIDITPRTDSAGPQTAQGTAASRPIPAGFGSIWQRLVDGVRNPRLTGAGTIIVVLIGLLGFALIAQVKSNNSTSTLSSDRPDDLVRILSDLDSRKDRLSTEITSLQSTKSQLNSGAESKQAALNAASARADELGILAGTLPAVGPGLVVALEPVKSPIGSIDVLQTVEELRGAGAEAMQISGTGGPAVRIIASTYFVDGVDNGTISVDGVQMSGTITITAIGDAQTMQTALTIPGGVDDSVERNGGTVLVQPATVAHVNAIAPATTLKYAHPAS